MTNLSDLVSASFREGGPTNACWARYSPPECHEYLEALKEPYMAQRIDVRAVIGILAEHWEIKVKAGQIRHHLRGDCQCQKT